MDTTSIAFPLTVNGSRFEYENEYEYEFWPCEIWHQYLVRVVVLTKIAALDCKQMYRSECKGFTVTISPCLAKKVILETSVYLIGDEKIYEEDFLAVYEIATKRRQHPYKRFERIDDIFDAISREEFEA